MDFMKLLGTVLAIFLHPGSTSKLNGQRICRRGTERPCYKISYYQDSRRRLTFWDARQACQGDGGDLLSIETENEQRLVERFIQQMQCGDGDFWIGLQRGGTRRNGTVPGCLPGQYSWLDGSQSTFRNWRWEEPACRGQWCVVLYHQPSALTNLGGHFLFRWNDDSCNSKNNFVCKYSEEKVSAFTVSGTAVKTGAPDLSLGPDIKPVTERNQTASIDVESSVSLSDSGLLLSYFLFGAIPVLVLLALATGLFCYRRSAQRRKTETDRSPSSPPPDQWAPPDLDGARPPFQGPYACSPVSKLPLEALGGWGGRGGWGVPPQAPLEPPQRGDYENVSSLGSECGFVTNDIYETCRGRGQTGWVENDIYG